MNAPDTVIEIDGCEVEIRTNRAGDMSWRCGYVTFPQGEQLPSDPEGCGAPVNGGITYAQGACFGWDYMHWFNVNTGTTMPSDDAVIAEARTLIAWVRSASRDGGAS